MGRQTKHCVLWIPTKRFRTDWELTPAEPYKDNISDKGKPLFIHAYKKNNSNDVHIEHRDGLGRKSSVISFIELQCETAMPNGLFLYKYEWDDADMDAAKLSQIITSRAIYHIIKGFYHAHEHHPKKEDSILKPYPESVDITKPDNSAMKFYLARWNQYFKAKLENDIQTPYDSFLALTYDKTQAGRYRILTKSSAIKEACDKALGCKLYCDTLITSADINNADIKSSVEEIKTSIKTIKQYRESVINEFNFTTSHISIVLGILSCYLGIFAFFPPIVSFCRDFTEPHHITDIYKQQETILYYDSIQRLEHQDIKEKLNSLFTDIYKQQETILYYDSIQRLGHQDIKEKLDSLSTVLILLPKASKTHQKQQRKYQ